MLNGVDIKTIIEMAKLNYKKILLIILLFSLALPLLRYYYIASYNIEVMSDDEKAQVETIKELETNLDIQEKNIESNKLLQVYAPDMKEKTSYYVLQTNADVNDAEDILYIINSVIGNGEVYTRCSETIRNQISMEEFSLLVSSEFTGNILTLHVSGVDDEDCNELNQEIETAVSSYCDNSNTLLNNTQLQLVQTSTLIRNNSKVQKYESNYLTQVETLRNEIACKKSVLTTRQMQLLQNGKEQNIMDAGHYLSFLIIGVFCGVMISSLWIIFCAYYEKRNLSE